MKLRALLVMLLALVFSASSVMAQGNDPAAVINAYTAAVNSNNIDAALALFADDAVISLAPDAPPTAIYSGKNAISTYLAGRFGDAVIEITEKPQVTGDKVTWTEKESYLATTTTQQVEATVQDGKINALTIVKVLATDPRVVPAGPAGRISVLVDVLNDHQLDSAVSIFSDDAVIKLSPDSPPPTEFLGKDQIRSHFQSLIEDGVHFDFVVPPQLVADKVVWTDKLSTATFASTQSLEAVVQDGKIESMVVTKLLSTEPRVTPTTGGAGGLDSTGLVMFVGIALLLLGALAWRRGSRRERTH